jgi:hypothetical protein
MDETALARTPEVVFEFPWRVASEAHAGIRIQKQGAEFRRSGRVVSSA